MQMHWALRWRLQPAMTLICCVKNSLKVKFLDHLAFVHTVVVVAVAGVADDVIDRIQNLSGALC